MAKKAKAAKKPAGTGKPRGRPAGSGKKKADAGKAAPKAAAPAAGDGSEAVKPGEVLRMPSEKVLKDLHRQTTALRQEGASLNGTVREKLGYAKEKHHLHTKAFADVQKLLKMEPARLNAYLAHFDFYADKLGLDALAESAPPLPFGENEDDDEGDDETPSEPHGGGDANAESSPGLAASPGAADAPNLGKPEVVADPPPRTLRSIPGGL